MQHFNTLNKYSWIAKTFWKMESKIDDFIYGRQLKKIKDVQKKKKLKIAQNLN